jgi:hypothetical protein
MFVCVRDGPGLIRRPSRSIVLCYLCYDMCGFGSPIHFNSDYKTGKEAPGYRIPSVRKEEWIVRTRFKDFKLTVE